MTKFIKYIFLLHISLGICLDTFAISKTSTTNPDSAFYLRNNPKLIKVTGVALSSLNVASWNSAWVDYDKDGDQDLFICNYDKTQSNVLFRNNGDGTFTRVTSGNLVKPYGISTVAASFADIDNDGFIDLATATNLGLSSKIFKNNGGGNFSALDTDVKNDGGYAHGMNWVDYDNDGYIDLFVTEYFPTDFSRLYHNDGNGNLNRVYNSLTEHQNYSTGTTWADYDGDGLLDVFIPNGRGPVETDQNNNLYHNDGNGNFTKITSGAIVNDGGNSTASTWGDYNNDGLLDLFVSNASNQSNFLYKNLGNGSFSRILQEPFISDKGNSHGCIWLDHNNDGWLDLIIVNDQGQQNFFYENNGDGTFTKITDEAIVNEIGSNKGISFVDYNKDGAIDVFITSHSELTPCVLYRNNQNPSQDWINIKLIGTSSNASGIGARVRIKIQQKGKSFWQVREITSTSGFGSQSELAAIFGIGKAKIIDSIEIRWPSGYYQYITNQAINKFLVVTEPNLKRVSGKIFDDTNNNGVFDSGEPGIPNIRININSNNYTFTDASGNFYAYLKPSVSYNISQAIPDYWMQKSPINNAGLNITVDQNGITNQNIVFANVPKDLGKDLSVNLSATLLRRGFINNMTLRYSNKGTIESINDTITITLEDNIHLLNASVPWTSNSGNTYKWVINSIPVGYSGAIRLTDSVDLSKPIGTIIALSSSISPLGDFNPLDNSDVSLTEIKGAVDPNDIDVFPRGFGEEGYIKSGTNLSYKIRFQNVGNYWANSVKIHCSLPKYLNLSTFKVKNVSHQNYMLLSDNGELDIFFDNINLIDSVSNEPESHGYFEFSVETFEGLAGDTKIECQAEIVFDYEEPLLTNIVSNTIEKADKIDIIQVYPNPSSDIINIVLDQTYGERIINKIEVYNMNGFEVFSKEGSKTNKVIFYKHNINQGFYLIKVIDDLGESYYDRVIVH